MRFLKLVFVLTFLVAFTSAQAASGSIVKVLPQLIDREGRNSLSPSLYERDAYQLVLRNHPDQRGGLRFAVLWNASRGKTLTLRIEMRGSSVTAPNLTTIERSLKKTGWFRRWTNFDFSGEDYKKLGELVAWRATMWDGDKLVGEQKSFLW